MSSSLITTLSFLTFILLQCASLVISQSNTLFSPVTKDLYTGLYTMLIYMKTPLQPSQLHLDLGSYIPWYDCDRHYKSSSYQPVIYNSSLCIDIDSKVWGNCFDKPGPGCANETCSFYPTNPVTLKGGMGSIFTDVFALPNPVEPGPAVSRFAFACTNPNKNSKIYRGLAKGTTGLASLGRFNYSLSGQISRVHSSPWIFALCLPRTYDSSGVVVFNSAGPYYFSSSKNKIDVSKFLTYTPLIQGPKGVISDTMNWYKSPDYYIGLTSFRVGNRVIRLNRTLLSPDENGVGGTLISTATPYTVLQSSVYNAVVDAFMKEAAKLNLTLYIPIEPFAVEPFTQCFHAEKVRTTPLGPVVPTIDLVFGSSNNIWRIHESNWMARIQNIAADGWCLAVLDGGPDAKPAVVIGGFQIHDNCLQFDLTRQRVGFSSSLLLHNTTCDNYEFGTK